MPFQPPPRNQAGNHHLSSADLHLDGPSLLEYTFDRSPSLWNLRNSQEIDEANGLLSDWTIKNQESISLELVNMIELYVALFNIVISKK